MCECKGTGTGAGVRCRCSPYSAPHAYVQKHTVKVSGQLRDKNRQVTDTRWPVIAGYKLANVGGK